MSFSCHRSRYLTRVSSVGQTLCTKDLVLFPLLPERRVKVVAASLPGGGGDYAEFSTALVERIDK
jgi:hypothetical protein